MKILCLGKGTYYNGYTNIQKILLSKKIDFVIGKSYKEINDKFDLVVSFGYDRIIPPHLLLKPRRGTVCFHSSDLPKGRGWAPLYYAIVNKETTYTLSLFFADAGCDTGKLIAKIKCKIHPLETIYTLRKKDDLMAEILFEKYIGPILNEDFDGTEQRGETSYCKRRFPQDSKIELSKPLMELLPKLRALPEEYPAFFEIDNIRATFKLNIDNNVIFNPQDFKYHIEDYRVYGVK